MSDRCDKCGRLIGLHRYGECVESQSASELPAPALLSCQYSKLDNGTVRTSCGDLLDADIENYGPDFCLRCGKRIQWHSQDNTELSDRTNGARKPESHE